MVKMLIIPLFGLMAAGLAGYLLFQKSTNSELPVLGPEGHQVPAFSFVNQNGDTTGSELLQGKIFVADFIFTSCPGICPKMTSEMKRVQEAYAGNENLKLISFTVDPERDSAQALATYMELYDVAPDVWTMYTGNKKSFTSSPGAASILPLWKVMVVRKILSTVKNWF